MSSEQRQRRSEEWNEMGLVETIKYTKEVIDAVGEGIEKILKAKKQGLIVQKRMGERFLEELKANKDEVMRAFLFSVKKEFRDTYLKWIRRIVEAVSE